MNIFFRKCLISHLHIYIKKEKKHFVQYLRVQNGFNSNEAKESIVNHK